MTMATEANEWFDMNSAFTLLLLAVSTPLVSAKKPCRGVRHAFQMKGFWPFLKIAGPRPGLSDCIELDLTSMGLTDVEAEMLAEELKTNNVLEELVLAGNWIGPSGAIALADALAENKHLHSLDLSNNNLNDEGASAIAEALRRNRVLEHLNLGRGNITSKGAGEIARMLDTNTRLHTLFLWHNDLEDEGARHIASTLGDNDALEVLYLQGNRIRTSGGVAIAKALRKNRALHTLDLSNNLIHNKGAMALAKALKSANKKVSSLGLRHNWFTEEGIKALNSVGQGLDRYHMWRRTSVESEDREL